MKSGSDQEEGVFGLLISGLLGLFKWFFIGLAKLFILLFFALFCSIWWLWKTFWVLFKEELDWFFPEKDPKPEARLDIFLMGGLRRLIQLGSRRSGIILRVSGTLMIGRIFRLS